MKKAEKVVLKIQGERESRFFRKIGYGYLVTPNALKRSVINLNLCSLFCSLTISVKKQHGFGQRMRGQGLEISCVNRDTLLHWQSLMFFICKMEVVDSAQWGDCTY